MSTATPQESSALPTAPAIDNNKRITIIEALEAPSKRLESMEALRAENRRLEKELAALQAWKASALEVESEWDSQAIARSLGGLPGQSCRKVIAQRVPELLAEIAALRSQLDQANQQIQELNDRMTTEVKSYMTSIAELRAENRRLEKELAHQLDMGCQAAVCGPKVALDEAIARMEAVPVEELMSSLYEIETSQDEAEQIRARLIAAARGQA